MWRFLAVFALLTQPVWAARIVITCYDGATSASVRWLPEKTITRVGACDVDRVLDGGCTFHVSLGDGQTNVPHVFDGRLKAGRRRRVRYGQSNALLECRPGPEPVPDPGNVPPPPGAPTISCQDTVLAQSTSDPVCDLEPACDDQCTFGFRCPVCCGCLVPCAPVPVYRIQVPVEKHVVIPPCEQWGKPGLVLECQPRPAGTACPTTTTTIPPVGVCRTDADCAIFPPVCQHCEVGSCRSVQTIEPNQSLSGVICRTPD